ncbi:MAG TPA: ATP synthase F1 subunit gamma [Gemmatimonadota bacterium]|jgi:F-type H+-transporting ATPase subunit gamma
MAKFQQLKRRIRSIRSTRQITKTMEMVSASKLRRAQERVVALRPFAVMLYRVIYALDVDPSLIEHPLLRQPEAPRRASIYLVTSNRGLAGAFNTNLVRMAEALRDKLLGEGLEVTMHVAGRRGAAALRYRGVPLATVWTDLSDRPSFAEADRLAQIAIEEFSSGATDQIWMVGSRYNSPVDTPPVTLQILPIGAGFGATPNADTPAGSRPGGQPVREKEGPSALYIITPSPEAIFKQIMPYYVRYMFYALLIETAASEHGARRTAMKNATDNAGELLDDLQRRFNRARQAQITQEIAELLGGAEALKT